MFKLNCTKLFLVVFIAFGFITAQTPDYYSSIDFSQRGDALKTQLSNLIIDTHTTDIPYTSSSTDTWDILRISDLENPNSENVLLLYGFDDNDGIYITDRTRNTFDTCHSSSCVGLWNREHVFAKSLANPSLITSVPGSGTDVHNLRPADSQKNSQRNNRLFIDDSGEDSKIVNGDYFFPGDEWKGDVARVIMYMYLRYPSQCEAINSASSNAIYSPNSDMPDIYLEWNEEDPVSALELTRNAIISSYQGNRNPFIDNPYLATMIWNGPAAIDSWGTLSSTIENEISINVFPNITNRSITINGLNNNNYEIFIYNQLGQKMIFSNRFKTIDVSSFPTGLYILHVESNNSVYQSKFIVK
ncbi:MAG: endonuclease [Bacteroidetes bacterium]|nr:endonuclease [Bacteroidota bacterium]MDA0860531.1 endonuclease [Bacteroidota bacterium]MDA1318743.1 endonuclease [Bacteroidota bacterium]